jgi:hypothetical protein
MMDLLQQYRSAATRLLNQHGITHQGEPHLEWCYEDRVFLWSVESAHHEATPLWILTGDCPPDYLLLQPAKTRREAIVLFAQRFAHAARALGEGQVPEIIVGNSTNDPLNDSELKEKLESYSALFYSLADAGAVVER